MKNIVKIKKNLFYFLRKFAILFLVPARNAIKSYEPNAYYHIYNRGVNGSPIFLDRKDYRVFLSYLKEYLSFRDDDKLRTLLSLDGLSALERDQINQSLGRSNFFRKIKLLAFTLKPNHFHLLVKQKEEKTIDFFMRSLATRYTLYFNRRHKRVGHLYQGVCKAVLVKTDEQLLHLTRYFHRQAIGFKKGKNFILYNNPLPSSYSDYLGKTHTPWVYSEEILSFFNQQEKKLSYRFFVEKYQAEEDLVQALIIE